MSKRPLPSSQAVARALFVEHPTVQSGRQGRVWTPGEVRQQLDLIERFLMLTSSRTQIRRWLAQPPDGKGGGGVGYDIKDARVRLLIERVQEGWATEDEHNRPHNKARQIRRVEGHLNQARAAKNFSAVAKFEALLVTLLGTAEPIEVRIESRVAFAARTVFANLTPERIRELAEQRRAEREKASAFDSRIVVVPKSDS